MSGPDAFACVPRCIPLLRRSRAFLDRSVLPHTSATSLTQALRRKRNADSSSSHRPSVSPASSKGLFPRARFVARFLHRFSQGELFFTFFVRLGSGFLPVTPTGPVMLYMQEEINGRHVLNLPPFFSAIQAHVFMGSTYGNLSVQIDPLAQVYPRSIEKEPRVL